MGYILWGDGTALPISATPFKVFAYEAMVLIKFFSLCGEFEYTFFKDKPDAVDIAETLAVELGYVASNGSCVKIGRLMESVN